MIFPNINAMEWLISVFWMIPHYTSHPFWLIYWSHLSQWPVFLSWVKIICLILKIQAENLFQFFQVPPLTLFPKRESKSEPGTSCPVNCVWMQLPDAEKRPLLSFQHLHLASNGKLWEWKFLKKWTNYHKTERQKVADINQGKVVLNDHFEVKLL